MNASDQSIRVFPRRENDTVEPRNYTEVGRAAVRAFLARTSGKLGMTAAAALLLQRAVPVAVVRLWVADDLFPSVRIERTARLAYPELARDFDELEVRRKAARERSDLELVGQAVEEAMAGLEWPDAAA